VEGQGGDVVDEVEGEGIVVERVEWARESEGSCRRGVKVVNDYSSGSHIPASVRWDRSRDHSHH
jgi:hypothetical protein